MDPSCRGPDDLVEPDETLWHDRGAGGGDPVPGFRMRHEEPILHLRIVLSQTTSAGIGMRGYIIAVSLSASMTSVAKTALGEELHHRSDRIVDERLFWHGQRDRIFSASSEGTRHPARGVRAAAAALAAVYPVTVVTEFPRSEIVA